MQPPAQTATSVRMRTDTWTQRTKSQWPMKWQNPSEYCRRTWQLLLQAGPLPPATRSNSWQTCHSRRKNHTHKLLYHRMHNKLLIRMGWSRYWVERYASRYLCRSLWVFFRSKFRQIQTRHKLRKLYQNPGFDSVLVLLSKDDHQIPLVELILLRWWVWWEQPIVFLTGVSLVWRLQKSRL